jgi:hypothetical protein
VGVGFGGSLLTDDPADIFADQGIFWYEAEKTYDLKPVLDTITNNCGDKWDSFTLGKYTGTSGGGDSQTDAPEDWEALVDDTTEYGLSANTPIERTDLVITYHKCKEHASGGDAALVGNVNCENVVPEEKTLYLVVKGTRHGNDYYFVQDPIKIVFKNPCLNNEVTLTPHAAANTGWTHAFTFELSPSRHP